MATTSMGYDAAGDLTTISLYNSSGTTLAYYDYQYDGANRVTQQSWASTTMMALSGTATYGYDAASQLTYDGSATTPTTYSYDGTGNRSGTSPVANKIQNEGGYSYYYDPAGNVTAMVDSSTSTTWTYSYDQENHLTGAVETVGGTAMVSASYTYDVLGRRVAQSEWVSGSSTVATSYSYDSNGNIWQTSTSLKVLTRYLYGDGMNQENKRCQEPI